MADVDKKKEWDAIRPMGKGRYMLGVFLQTFALAVLALFINELIPPRDPLTAARIVLKLAVALICSGAYTLLWGMRTWNSLEREFGKSVKRGS